MFNVTARSTSVAPRTIAGLQRVPLESLQHDRRGFGP